MLCEMTATDFSLPESRLYFLFTLFSSRLSLLLSAIYLPSSLVACHEGINPSCVWDQDSEWFPNWKWDLEKKVLCMALPGGVGLEGTGILVEICLQERHSALGKTKSLSLLCQQRSG